MLFLLALAAWRPTARGISQPATPSPSPPALDCNANDVPDAVDTSALDFASARGNYPGQADRVAAAADFDGDGDLDIAIPGPLSIFFNPGDGRFGTAKRIDIAEALAVAAIDLDGDGDIDLATGFDYTHHLRFYYNMGGGVFGAAREIPIPFGAQLLATADIDDDGTPDLVAAGIDSVAVLYNLGGGDFTLGRVAYSPFVYPDHLSVVDFDTDGDPDVVVGSDRSAVALNAGGVLQNPVMLWNDGNGPAFAFGDLDGDADVDAVAGDDFFYAVRIGLNQGGSVTTGQELSFMRAVHSVHLEDRDGDADLDIVGVTSSEAFFLRNDGSGRFEDAGRAPTAGGGFALLADFDGDADSDLAVVGGRAQIVLVRGVTGGGFVSPTTAAVGQDPQSVAVADVDDDGDLDIVTANFRSDTISVIRTEDGVLAAPVAIFAGRMPMGLASGDLDDDGDVDLVVGHTDTGFPTTVNTVSVLTNPGDGNFTKTVDLEAGSGPDKVILADLANDGFPDIVVGGVFGYVALFRNDAGTFAPRQEIPVGDIARSIAAGDIDGDGDIDLVVANGGPGLNLVVLRNRGDGSFDDPEIPINVDEPVRVALADLEPDGDLDIVVVTSYGRVVVSLNFGLAGFARPIINDLTVQSASLAMADADRDGDPDIVAVAQGLIAVLRHGGDGIFTANDFFVAGGAPQGLAVGNIAGDAAVDIVSTDTDLHKVQLTANLTAPSTSEDCNANRIPDECELGENDCDENAVPDECQADEDMDSIPDNCDLCACDCNGDGYVYVDELITAVQVVLGDAFLGQCRAVDADRDGAAGIGDLILGVRRALNGCHSADGATSS